MGRGQAFLFGGLEGKANFWHLGGCDFFPNFAILGIPFISVIFKSQLYSAKNNLNVHIMLQGRRMMSNLLFDDPEKTVNRRSMNHAVTKIDHFAHLYYLWAQAEGGPISPQAFLIATAREEDMGGRCQLFTHLCVSDTQSHSHRTGQSKSRGCAEPLRSGEPQSYIGVKGNISLGTALMNSTKTCLVLKPFLL